MYIKNLDCARIFAKSEEEFALLSANKDFNRLSCELSMIVVNRIFELTNFSKVVGLLQGRLEHYDTYGS